MILSMKSKVKKIAKYPKVKEVVRSIKPTKSVWGFLGVILFFIVPEMVAFAWGEAITDFATAALTHADTTALQAYYKALIFLFEDGGSWVNLGVGAALLLWLFF